MIALMVKGFCTGCLLFCVIAMCMCVNAQERTLDLNEWLGQTHCTKLISTCMEDGQKLYVVEDCEPGNRMSKFEIDELRKALEIMYPIKEIINGKALVE